MRKGWDHNKFNVLGKKLHAPLNLAGPQELYNSQSYAYVLCWLLSLTTDVAV